MGDFWTLGPTATALSLRAWGFSAREADRLVALRLRYLRSGFREMTDEQKRLRFARWLVDHGQLTEGVDKLVET